VPPSGPQINVTLRYEEKGKTITVSGKDWLCGSKGKKLPNYEWVYAGSKLVPNNINPQEPPYFLANDGDVICVSNFETALLDLPIKSPKDNADLVFVANTERIPPLETKVVVVLEPLPAPQK
jgi:hypothetical protein